MKVLLPTLIIVFDLVIPAVLILWVWKSRAKSRLYFLSIVSVAVAYLGAVTQSFLGFWYVLGTFWPYLFFLVLALTMIVRMREGIPKRWIPQRATREPVGTALNALHTLLWFGVMVGVFQSKTAADESVALSPPLRNGNYLVIGGGGNLTVNPHTGAVRYAMDISRLNKFGFRAGSASLFPSDLTRYEIFSAEIVAPCEGEVIDVENAVRDASPLQPDLSGFGNHVALFCQGHTIRLFHMREGSVKVAVGDRVAVGQSLGNVGNSGNSFEPHLHIDAVAGRHEVDARNDGRLKSVPIKINGRFLIKGDSFAGI